MAPVVHPRAAWNPAITHGLLVSMLIGYWALLVWAPFWLAFVPGVLLAHRIGIMGHEYIHGIPFKRYKHCLAVVTVIDGLMLMFGIHELYRGMHLAHHRWLNGPGDAAAEAAHQRADASHRVVALLGSGEVAKHLRLLALAIRGRHPFARAERIAWGVLASLMWIGLWLALGRGDVVWKCMVIVLATAAGPASLRAAIEHSSDPGDPGFANEYEVVLTLFNLNKHHHHHLEPGLPWYLLEYKTARPLPWHAYFTHWYHVHVARDFTTMKPMKPMKSSQKTATLPRGRRR